MAKLKQADYEYSKRQIEKELKKSVAFSSKRNLAKKAGLRWEHFKDVYVMYPELELLRQEGLRELSHKVVDNFTKVLLDPEHKDHFQATKMFLNRYKSSLDGIFEERDQKELTAVIGESDPEGNKRVIQLTFKPQDKVEEIECEDLDSFPEQ